MTLSGIASALLAAVLFGLSTPLAKLLVQDAGPFVLAGIFYLGAGIGLAVLRLALPGLSAAEKSLSRADLPWAGGAIFFGGLLGPLLLMIGLTLTEAATASLLLVMEGIATALIAWFAFRENFDRRIAVGMLMIVAGAAILSWRGTAQIDGLLGPLAILGACIAWGIDNNLTRKVSLADPTQIAMLKGLVAGPVNLAVGLLAGEAPPVPATALLAGLVGLGGYGISLALFVLSLRHLGTARTGAYFSIAPFVGAIAAVPLLGEAVSVQLGFAALLMGAGVWLHLTERHEHEHEHGVLEHEHRHVHDAHHQHRHHAGEPAKEPHSHRHVHVRLRHAHPHAPDSHHRHSH